MVNQSVAFFLCPPSANYFGSLACSGQDGAIVSTDLVKRQIIAHSLQTSTSLMPTLSEMKALGAQCYGITEDESSVQSPLDLYMALSSLIQVETGVVLAEHDTEDEHAEPKGPGPQDNLELEDTDVGPNVDGSDEEATLEDADEGVLEITGEGMLSFPLKTVMKERGSMLLCVISKT